uniref:FMR1-interacting protein 1 conserved domain-containing protein n=1 Tax=Vitis vinifera TaxID=29760 RepID=F6HIY7_VITVI
MGEVGGWTPLFLRPFNDWGVEEVERLLSSIQGKRLDADGEDRMLWRGTKNEIFTVKSLYKSLDHSCAVSFPGNIIWSPYVPSKGNFVKDAGVNNSNPNWKNSSRKNFMKNPKGKNSHWGSRKSQLHHMQNARGKAGISNENRGKGLSNNMAGNLCRPNFTYQDKVEKKRPLPLNYTEQEIQNWREERKKNYPSKINLEKKSAEKLTNSEVIEAEVKSRRQQLKEILAKQAELGVEVAEIPPHYLSDSEKQQVHGREENNKKAFGKKERFQNRGNKRRRHDRKQWQRHDQEDGFTKKQRLAGKDSGDMNASNQPPLNKKKQTLLQKLLSTDIKRDKRHLLQVFRFMAMNSFFKDWPEKPLKFPLVVVKETGCQGEVVDRKSSPTSKGVPQGGRKTAAEEFSNVDEADDAQAKETAHFGKVEGSSGDEIERSEEEGEIID